MTRSPTKVPAAPTNAPTKAPTSAPKNPTAAPKVATTNPTKAPTAMPKRPSSAPKTLTVAPIVAIKAPTKTPSATPKYPTIAPKSTTVAPKVATKAPTVAPKRPTSSPNTPTAPIKTPVAAPAAAPKTPVKAPTAAPKASTAPAFNIQLAFSSNVPATHQAVITQAKEKWESVITGDMPDDNLAGLPINGNCNHPTAVDDLYICAEYIKINVPGVVGYGSSQWINPSSGLPSNGHIQFDPDAATSMLANGRFLPVIMHEMGHVLGRFRAAPNGWSVVVCRSRAT
jgi:hypothetical protein